MKKYTAVNVRIAGQGADELLYETELGYPTNNLNSMHRTSYNAIWEPAGDVDYSEAVALDARKFFKTEEGLRFSYRGPMWYYVTDGLGSFDYVDGKAYLSLLRLVVACLGKEEITVRIGKIVEGGIEWTERL
jgi:hypothetical protein